MKQAGFKSKAAVARKIEVHLDTIYSWQAWPKPVELYFEERIRNAQATETADARYRQVLDDLDAFTKQRKRT